MSRDSLVFEGGKDPKNNDDPRIQIGAIAPNQLTIDPSSKNMEAFVPVPPGARPNDEIPFFDAYGLRYLVRVPANNNGEPFLVRLGDGVFIAARDNNIKALDGLLADTRRVPQSVKRPSDDW